MVKLLLLLLCLACTHDKILDIGKTYKKTLRFAVNGQRGSGVLVAKKSGVYHLEIFTPQKPNILKVTSCHQERIFYKPGKSIEFDFIPNPDIETDETLCFIDISAIEESGKNQWGLVDFKNSFSLPGRINCNGDSGNAIGNSVCQARAGLMQSIQFASAVKAVSPELCDKMRSEDGRTFIFNITEGSCFYLFQGTDGNIHRLVTFGYNEVLPDDQFD